nr:MAG TPA: hypothetical protein [Caudoviricetes sp.]
MVFILIAVLLSAHALDNKVCVRKHCSLRAGVFSRHSNAATAGNFHEGRHIDIEIVFNGGRRNGCSRTVQRFAVDSKRRSNSFHCAASRDSNVCTEAHFETRFALVRKPSQGDNSCTFTMHNAALTCHRRFSQRHVLACCHAHGIRVCKFSHKIIPFKKR